jgi:hypothetical protein
LSAPVSAAATTMPVKNTVSIVADDYVVVGLPGKEQSEQAQISSVDSDTQFTSDALDFLHSTDEVITFTDFVQIQIYSSTSSDGTYTLLATVDIDWSSNITEYVDLTGVSTNYYKWRYYNPTVGTTSDYSDPVPGTNWAYNTVATLTDEILKEVKDEDEVVTNREEILTWLNDCERDIKSRRKKLSDLKTTDNLVPTADTEAVSLPSNYDHLDYLEYHYDEDSDGTVETVYRLRYITPIEFAYITEDKTLGSSDALEKFTIDEVNQTVKLYPTPDTTGSETTGSYLVLSYYKDLTRLDSDGDTVAFKNPKLYKDYCMDRFYRKKSEGATGKSVELNIANLHRGDYERGIVDLIKSEPTEISHPKGFQYNSRGFRRYYKY